MRLTLVRHGQTAHNVPGADHADPDPPLTETGREQAARAARAMAALGPFDALYAGPQRRALETAAFLSRTVGRAPHIHPDLCECGGLGEHPGLTRAQIREAWPEATLDDAIGEAGWWRGGESSTDETTFHARAIRAAAWLSARHHDAGEHVAVVTHGRFGSALIGALLGLEPAGYNRFSLDNGGITQLDWAPQAAVGYLPGAPGAVAVRLRFHNAT